MPVSLRAFLAASVFLLPLGAFAQSAPPAKAQIHPGKADVEAICTSCHVYRLIEQSLGYSRDDWKTLTASMIDLSTHKSRDAMYDYLATKFPPNDRRKPVIVPGKITLSFQEWRLPTLGQRARDPVEAPDGSIWWTGQFVDIVGRIDPKSGAIKEYKLPPGSKAHSITPDTAGNIWFTGNGNGTIGKIEPVSGKITVYPMQDKEARDPHTAVFGKAGILWFTAQHSNLIGRLDPATGDIKLVKIPRSRALPYGIKVDSKGIVWASCNGSNCVLRIDPKTMALKIVDLPQKGSTVRRLAISSDDAIWYVNSEFGYLGRIDPKTGAIKEWPTPSGRGSEPYAIEILNDIVWFNESGKRPDPLVRFDPKTETFQSWTVPTRGIHAGQIRHMRQTKNGDLLIHTGATNSILRVTIHEP